MDAKWTGARLDAASAAAPLHLVINTTLPTAKHLFRAALYVIACRRSRRRSCTAFILV